MQADCPPRPTWALATWKRGILTPRPSIIARPARSVANLLPLQEVFLALWGHPRPVLWFSGDGDIFGPPNIPDDRCLQEPLFSQKTCAFEQTFFDSIDSSAKTHVGT